jgi:hypothetical protein
MEAEQVQANIKPLKHPATQARKYPKGTCLLQRKCGLQKL